MIKKVSRYQHGRIRLDIAEMNRKQDPDSLKRLGISDEAFARRRGGQRDRGIDRAIQRNLNSLKEILTPNAKDV